VEFRLVEFRLVDSVGGGWLEVAASSVGGACPLEVATPQIQAVVNRYGHFLGDCFRSACFLSACARRHHGLCNQI